MYLLPPLVPLRRAVRFVFVVERTGGYAAGVPLDSGAYIALARGKSCIGKAQILHWQRANLTLATRKSYIGKGQQEAGGGGVFLWRVVP